MLRYFSDDGQRLIRESFDDAGAASRATGSWDPGTIEAFNSELRRASKAFPPGIDRELGYLLPADDAHLRHTATLVVHEHIAKELKDAFDRDLRMGRVSLVEGDRKIRDIAAERGLYRGFEDLLNHVGTFGTHVFFPLLYFQAAQSIAGKDDPIQPLRVLNLSSLIQGVGRFSGLFARMPKNLAERGAFNRASRVEHRFKLQGEDD